MPKNTISHTLNNDPQGKIQTFISLESKKDQVKLYFKIIRGEIPFSEFGNLALLQIFKSADEGDIIDFVADLLTDIRNQFQLDITDYDIQIDNGKIKIKLYLTDGDIIDETIFE